MVVRLLVAFLSLGLSIVMSASASADLITYEFAGTSQASINSVFFPSVDFQIRFVIDDAQPDEAPGQAGRGFFSGGQAFLTIASEGIVNELSSNVTGLALEDFGNERIRLVEPTTFFGLAAVGADYSGGGAIADVNSLQPLLDPTPAPTSQQAGLAMSFTNDPTLSVTFFSVTSLTIENLVSVPEPSGAAVLLLAGGAFVFRRRRPAPATKSSAI